MLSEETIQSENKILQDLVVIAIAEYDDKLQRIQDGIKNE